MQLCQMLSKILFENTTRFVVKWVLFAQLAVDAKQVEIKIIQHKPSQRLTLIVDAISEYWCHNMFDAGEFQLITHFFCLQKSCTICSLFIY